MDTCKSCSKGDSKVGKEIGRNEEIKSYSLHFHGE